MILLPRIMTLCTFLQIKENNDVDLTEDENGRINEEIESKITKICPEVQYL